MTETAYDLSLVIACYNEAPHLETNVAQVLETLDCTRWVYELIFVDDGSEDQTRAIIDKLLAKYPDKALQKLFHEKTTGRGRAVADGIRLARGKTVGFIDIDLEVHARYILAMVIAVRNGADIATARRIYKLVPSLLHRHVLSRGYLWLMNLLLGVDLDDTEAGCKFFNRERILPILDDIESEGWFWDTEVMVRPYLAGYQIAYVPALFIKCREKKSTVHVFRDSYDYFLNLWRFQRTIQELRGRSEASGGLGENMKSKPVGTSRANLYSSRFLYHFAMRLLYGRYFQARYEAVAEEIPPSSRVVDVCAGDCYLYRKYLQRKSVNYQALDVSPELVSWASGRGIEARRLDVRAGEIPVGDIVVMQASLYQFLPHPSELVEKLLDAARQKVIIAEPIRNLSSSRKTALAWIARRWTTPPSGHGDYSGQRFEENSLRVFFASIEGFERSFLIPGGREMVGVFKGRYQR